MISDVGGEFGVVATQLYSPASDSSGPTICNADVTLFPLACSLILNRPDSPVSWIKKGL